MVAPCANELYILKYAYFDIIGQFLNALNQFYHKITISLIVFCLMLFCIVSCKKDIPEPLPKTHSTPYGSGNTDITFRNDSDISVLEARQWFTNNYGTKKHIEIAADTGSGYDIAPVWAFADEGYFGGDSIPIVVAPLQEISQFEYEDRTAYFMVVYRKNGNIESNVALCIGDDTYAESSKVMNPDNFSGLVLWMDMDGNALGNFFVLEGGSRVAEIFPDPDSPDILASVACDDPDPSNCYNFGGSFFGGILAFFNNLASILFGDNTPANSTTVIWIPGTWSPFFPGQNDGVTTGGGGGGSNESGGSPLEFHHIANPLIHIEEYMETEMGVETPVFQIFGFLNAEERMFLANYLPFIDLAYDYLTLHNHSAQARQVIKDAIYLFLHYPVPNFQAGLDVADLYQEMTTNGQTNLSLSEFWELYKLVVNVLQPQLGLNQSEVNFLLTHPEIAYQLKDFFDIHSFANGSAKNFANYCIDIAFQELGITFTELIESYEDFLDLENPVDAPEEQEIQNGIDIIQTEVPSTIPTGTPIGSNTPRGNTEDLEFGTNGDAAGILPSLLNKPDQELFTIMTNLFNACTFYGLNPTALDFIQRFKDKTGGEYHHPDVSYAVSQTKAMRNFIKRFGVKLNEALQGNNGNINGIEIELGDDRPQFSTLYHTFHGLKILINDTEHTTFKKLDFNLDPITGEWEGTFFFEVTDHFGLDKRDVLKFQSKHSGFAAWWLLQHKRDYRPFKTKIWVKATIRGDIN